MLFVYLKYLCLVLSSKYMYMYIYLKHHLIIHAFHISDPPTGYKRSFTDIVTFQLSKYAK